MSFCSLSPKQNSYNIIERGWFTDTVRAVSKEEFLLHQGSRSTFSINTIIKTLAAGILGASQALRPTPFASIGSQISLTALSCSLWSQIPTAAGQITTSTTLPPIPTPAPGPQGNEFQINTYTISDQTNPSVAVLAGGGFVVTWQSFGQDKSGGGIYGQRYDTSGTKVGSEFQINTYTTNDQSSPIVAALPGGGFVVVWQSFGQDEPSYGIFGQRYDASGMRVGSEFQINTYTIGYQQAPSLAVLSSGGFVVTWESNGQDGSKYGIYGQRYDASGVKVGPEFQVNTYTTMDQSNSIVGALSGGGFVVAWNSNGQDGDSYGIYGQRYDAKGTKVGAEFQINSNTTNYQDIPTLAALTGGGFVVSWVSYEQDGSDYGVYGQRYDALGEKAGSEFRINTYTTGAQFNPVATALSNGGFVVAWNSNGQDGDSYGIYGQRYDATGIKIGNEFQINIYTQSNQFGPSLAALGGGDFVATWQSQTQDGDSSGIFGRLFLENSTPRTSPTTVLSKNTNQTKKIQINETATITYTNTQTASQETTGPIPFLTSAAPTINSEGNHSAITGIATSPSGNNIPLFAGLAGGVGAVACSLVAGVVFFIKKRSKRKPNVGEQGIDMPALTSNQPQVISEADINSANQYKHIPIQSGHVDQTEYKSARFEPQPRLYSDPNERLRELERNPPQAIYGDAHELERLNKAMAKQTDPGSGSSGYDTTPYNSVPGKTVTYSNPLTHLEELRRNPPQANYIDEYQLKKMNAEVPS